MKQLIAYLDKIANLVSDANNKNQQQLNAEFAGADNAIKDFNLEQVTLWQVSLDATQYIKDAHDAKEEAEKTIVQIESYILKLSLFNQQYQQKQARLRTMAGDEVGQFEDQEEGQEDTVPKKIIEHITKLTEIKTNLAKKIAALDENIRCALITTPEAMKKAGSVKIILWDYLLKETTTEKQAQDKNRLGHAFMKRAEPNRRHISITITLPSGAEEYVSFVVSPKAAQRILAKEKNEVEQQSVGIWQKFVNKVLGESEWKLGKCYEKEEDVHAYYTKQRYSNTQIVTIEGDAANLLALQAMYDKAKEFKGSKLAYHIFKNNCATPIIDVLKAGNAEKILRTSGLSLTAVANIDSPTAAFNYSHLLKKELVKKANKQKNENSNSQSMEDKIGEVCFLLDETTEQFKFLSELIKAESKDPDGLAIIREALEQFSAKITKTDNNDEFENLKEALKNSIKSWISVLVGNENIEENNSAVELLINLNSLLGFPEIALSSFAEAKLKNILKKQENFFHTQMQTTVTKLFSADEREELDAIQILNANLTILDVVSAYRNKETNLEEDLIKERIADAHSEVIQSENLQLDAPQQSLQPKNPKRKVSQENLKAIQEICALIKFNLQDEKLPLQGNNQLDEAQAHALFFKKAASTKNVINAVSNIAQKNKHDAIVKLCQAITGALRTTLGEINQHIYFTPDNKNGTLLDGIKKMLSTEKTDKINSLDGVVAASINAITNIESQTNLTNSKTKISNILSNKESPAEKWAQIKEKIADKKPSLTKFWRYLQFWRYPEYKRYSQLEHLAQRTCIVMAFKEGHLDEMGFCLALNKIGEKTFVDEFKEKYKNNEAMTDTFAGRYLEQISSYAGLLRVHFKGNNEKLNIRYNTGFKQFADEVLKVETELNGIVNKKFVNEQAPNNESHVDKTKELVERIYALKLRI